MRYVVLLLVLIFTGCAGIPKTSVVDCEDKVGILNKYAFECIESAETVTLSIRKTCKSSARESKTCGCGLSIY